MKNLKSIQNARRLLRECEVGVLSTHSKSHDGYPFGSVSTYLSTVNGDVIFYISDLAQHTKNLAKNAKMCFTVFSQSVEASAKEDPNAGARLSLLGEARVLDKQESEQIKERYFSLNPKSRAYQNTHDFQFYKLEVERARFIGGFGDINWISKDDWHIQTPKWLDAEQSMIDHMNEDHVDAMQAICQAQGISATRQQAKMLMINPDGCFIQTGQGKPTHIPFSEIADSSTLVRQQLVRLTHSARASLSH